MTVRTLLTRTMSLIGVIGSGEAMSAAESADALLSANDLLETWSTEGLMLYKFEKVASNISSGDVSEAYTQDPANIEYAMQLISGVETPVRILTHKEWASIADKTSTGSIIESIFIQGANSGALIFPYPVPSANVVINLYRKTTLTAFASLDTALAWPQGYGRAFRFALAGDLAPEYGKELSPKIEQTARESKAYLKRLNSKPVKLKSDAYGLSSKGVNYDINGAG